MCRVSLSQHTESVTLGTNPQRSLINRRYLDSPGFRDGVIGQAVDEVGADMGTLHFESAGNKGLGRRFTSVSDGCG